MHGLVIGNTEAMIMQVNLKLYKLLEKIRRLMKYVQQNKI